MSQYFENDENIVSKERIIEFDFLGSKLRFIVDNGVFSKSEIDGGSLVLLKAISPLDLGDKILDLGCGYGTIGITLATVHKNMSVLCTDVNIRALALCERNAKMNKLDQRITCLESDIYEKIEGKFDSIVINPPIRAGKKIIYSMFSGAHDHLIDGGSLYIVIRKSHGAVSAAKYIESVFKNVELIDRDKGFHVYKATK